MESYLKDGGNENEEPENLTYKMTAKNWNHSHLETLMKYPEVVTFYYNAIKHHKNDIEGKVVLDLSQSGGLFSLFTIAAGAKLCFIKATNSNDAKAKLELIEANQCIDKVRLITDLHQVSGSISVILNQAFGRLPFANGKILEVIDARDSHLDPRGIIIPNEIKFLIGAIEDPSLAKELESDWRFSCEDEAFFDHASEVAGSFVSRRDMDCHYVKSKASLIRKVNLLTVRKVDCTNIKCAFTLRLLHDECVLHGLILCFEVSRMSSRFTNWPGSKRVFYEPNVFALREPIRGGANNTVRGTLEFRAIKNSITIEGYMAIKLDPNEEEVLIRRLREIHFEP